MLQLKAYARSLNNSPRMLQLEAYDRSINNRPPVNDEKALEHEADVMGNKALAAGAAQPAARDGSESPAQDPGGGTSTVQAHGSRAVVQRVNWDEVKGSADIQIELEGSDYVAYFQGRKAGRLELYDDDGRQWINFVETEEQFQRRGIGLFLVNAAVNDHGEIYAATGMGPEDENGDDDTRHLSMEGAALVTSAVRNGILRPEWCFNPAMGNERGEEDDSDGSHDDEEDVGGMDDDGGHEEMGQEVGEDDDQQENSGEEEEAGPTWSAVVMLDDSRTGGVGYQYSVDLENSESGEITTVEFTDLVSGGDDFTLVDLQRALSRALGENIVLNSWDVAYAD